MGQPVSYKVRVLSRDDSVRFFELDKHAEVIHVKLCMEKTTGLREVQMDLHAVGVQAPSGWYPLDDETPLAFLSSVSFCTGAPLRFQVSRCW